MSPFRSLVSLARTLAALAVIPLGLLPGLGVWLATRDRRATVNRTLSAWGDWGPGADRGDRAHWTARRDRGDRTDWAYRGDWADRRDWADWADWADRGEWTGGGDRSGRPAGHGRDATPATGVSEDRHPAAQRAPNGGEVGRAK